MDFSSINPMRFVQNLIYMGLGMLGVFMIIAVIMGATYLTMYLTTKKPPKKNDNNK